MKLLTAVEFFKREVQKVIEQGYSIESVQAEQEEDGEVLITVMSPDNSVLTHVAVNRQLMVMQLLELIFAQTANEIEALHRIKTMPSAAGQ